LRDVRVLADHPPEDLVGYPRVVRLNVSLGVLVAALAVLAVAFPWGVARGVRDLLGLPERLTPSWLVGPPVPTEFLAYDFRTAVLVQRPDGTVDRVPGDETGEITAPPGVTVEVSGRLTVSVSSGVVVLVAGESETTVPLAISPDGGFMATFRAVQSGTWHVSVRTASSGILVEVARRKVSVGAIGPPTVAIEPPERLGLKPGESVAIRYTADSSMGLAGVDAVYAYPLDPDRPPSRVHLRDLPPGTRRASGEVVFAMPDGVAEPAARIEIVVEAFGRPAGTGRSDVVPLFLDVPRHRASTAVDAADRLLDAVLGALADMIEGAPADGARLARLASAAVRLGAEARPAVEPLAAALGEAASALSDGAAAVDPVRALERAATALDRAVEREERTRLLAGISDLAREAGRLRAAASSWKRGAAPSETATAQRSLARARRTLRLVETGHRRIDAAAFPETGPDRVEAARLGEAWSRAVDALTAAEEALRGGKGEPAAATARAAAAVEEAAAASRRGQEEQFAGARGVEVGAEVAAWIRAAMTAQRETMDRTAQAAFDLKQKADALAAERAPDAGRLGEQAGEAGAMLDRVAADRLDAPDAAELASIRENLSAVRDLLEGRDLDTALKVMRDVVDRTALLASQVRDQADWLEDDRARDAGAMRAQATRILKSIAPLRDVLRALAAWNRERDAAIGPAERERLRELKQEQDRVMAIASRIVEAFRAAAGGADIPPAATAARRNTEEASRRLAELKAHAAEAHQRQAIQELMRLRRALEQGAEEPGRKRAASVHEEPDEVRIPAPGTAQRAPDALRREVRTHSVEPAAEGFGDLVKAYYEALLRPM